MCEFKEKTYQYTVGILNINPVSLVQIKIYARMSYAAILEKPASKGYASAGIVQHVLEKQMAITVLLPLVSVSKNVQIQIRTTA